MGAPCACRPCITRVQRIVLRARHSCSLRTPVLRRRVASARHVLRMRVVRTAHVRLVHDARYA